MDEVLNMKLIFLDSERNPDLLDALVAQYANYPTYLRHLDSLAHFLQQHGIRNVQEKVADSGGLDKFDSQVTESTLLIALILALRQFNFLYFH
jgi:hypothetical protein